MYIININLFFYFFQWVFVLISINHLLTVLNSSFNFMIYLSFCGRRKKKRRRLRRQIRRHKLFTICKYFLFLPYLPLPLSPRVNFINILQAAFARTDPKSVIKTDNLIGFFLRFQDLQVQKLLVERQWNRPLISSISLSTNLSLSFSICLSYVSTLSPSFSQSFSHSLNLSLYFSLFSLNLSLYLSVSLSVSDSLTFSLFPSPVAKAMV